MAAHNHHASGSCDCKSSNTTVHQTIDEMEFERGIWTAAMDNDTNKVGRFIQSGQVDASDNFGYTALHYAARSGLVEMCKLLLDGGAVVDSRTKTGGVTPLQRAAMKGRLDVVQLLVERGASVRVQDVDGKTALHRAVEGSHKAVIEYLLVVDPFVAQIADNHQETPFAMATQRHDETLMNLFTKAF